MARKRKPTTQQPDTQTTENIELENTELENEETPLTVIDEVETTPTPTPTPEIKTDEDGDDVVVLPVPKAKASNTVKVTETPQVEKVSTSLDTISLPDYLRHKYKFNLNSASVELKSTIEFLDRYEERMRSDAGVEKAQGESLQRQLYKTYLTIFSLQDTTERQVAMEILLWKFFKNEKGAFSVIGLARFTRGGRWPIEELNMFLQLNHVFNRIKNPLTRGIELKQFKISAIVGSFPTDKARYTEGFLNWTTTL